MVVDLVIGSGPAGIATARGLLARGRSVTLVDVGGTLEPARAAARDALAAEAPADWSAATRAGWQAPQFASPPGQVRRYGSDFAMEPADATFADPGGLTLRASHAVGGLSNLWGAAVLPYAAQDMAGWPITADDLAPHYAAVTEFLPVAGGRDRLEALFPTLSMRGRTPLPPGPQAERVLKLWRAALGGQPDPALTLGLSRQAVAPGCRLCGQCLHGCPWGLIWSAAQELPRLREDPRFAWSPGAPVRRIEEGPDGVTLIRADGTTETGERVFLAAGVLESARILLASRPGAHDSLTLRDSPHGFLPMLDPSLPRKGRPHPDRGPLHTLAKLFLELDDATLSPHLIHSQIYSWNEFYAPELIANYGRRLPGSAPLWRALARRLMVAQVFLHSDHGPTINLSLAPDGSLTSTVTAAPDLPTRFGAVAGRIAAAMTRAGLKPLTRAARLAAPGASFHAGATVPMARNPRPGQSDPLGRPYGLSRLHLTDASCLPAIPATTITLPVMANAHRIASLSP
jgi:choline dehydrogenase-like flavoprotein